MPEFKRLLKKNSQWVNSKLEHDHQYFTQLAKGQKPDFLWIGCSDSRIRVNHLAGTHAGEIFVHRNIANQIFPTDINLMSALQYAVEILEVNHVIICGHYGCGGIKAAIDNDASGYIDAWISNIKSLYHDHEHSLKHIADENARADKLAEINVVAQVDKLANTDIIKRSWEKRDFKIHAVIYDIYKGHLTELKQQNRISDTK